MTQDIHTRFKSIESGSVHIAGRNVFGKGMVSGEETGYAGGWGKEGWGGGGTYQQPWLAFATMARDGVFPSLDKRDWINFFEITFA